MHKVGDELIYAPKGVKCRVIRTLPNDVYVVEWNDKELIPPYMNVPGTYLVPELPYVDTLNVFNTKETHCPRCGTQWTETPIGAKLFYDCLKCNLKREDA